MTGYKFDVHIETMPMSDSKHKLKRKKQIVEAIREKKGEEISSARIAFSGKKIIHSVKFYLEKPTKGKSDSIGKKDLDNMLKLVLDSLQTKTDSAGKEDGLGLISNDDCVSASRQTRGKSTGLSK